MSSDKHLLPRTIVPHHYEIEIDIDLKDLKFSGKQVIDVEVKEATNNVVFHSKELEVSDIAVFANGKSHSISSVDHVLENHTISVTLDEALSIGKAQVHMSFGAPIKDNMKGLYYSKYTGVDGEERYMATTQFEADDARACFPCWDEPACKSTFSISLVVDKTLTALSNMPEESSVPASDSTKRLVRYAKSPVMSTYLLAIIVCDFEYVQCKSKGGVDLRVYVQKGKQEQGELALDICKQSLEYYEDYFQIAYPLPKLDLIGIPDFSMGAMENWGLVTFREVCLLFDPVHSSMQTKQSIAITIAHEIAHQWFGNLVTMQWWTHLWLNEGYATFMQFLCVDHMYPDFKIWTQFVVKEFDSVLGLDSLENTHPVEVEVKTSTEIDEIFDLISYEKGSSIIRMLHKYLGDEHFRKGMSLYLTRHMYGNTVTEDLWAALAESSGKPVQEMMEAWTSKPGYPVVSVETREEGDKTVLCLSQERFYMDGRKDEEGCLWKVPIDVVCSADKETRSFLMTDKTAELTLPKLDQTTGWVKVNTGACGFYRTRYSPSLLARLGSLILSKQLDNVDRLNVLGDLMNMVKSGYNSTVDAFKFMESYAQEDDYSVFVSLGCALSDINWLLEHDAETKGKMSPLITKIFSGIYTKLGWELIEGEDPLHRLLRPLAIGALGKIGYPPVLEKARSLLAASADGTGSIPADLRHCVYRTCMLHCGDGSTQHTLIKMWNAAETPEEKNRLSSGIVATKDLEQLEKGIAFAMKELRAQDMHRVLFHASVTSPQGATFIWNYFKDNVESFKTKYQNDGDFLSFLTKLITQNFASEAMAKDIEAFFASNDVRRHKSGLKQNLETIRLNASWLARDRQAILEYFAKAGL